uniref:Uncharacterized protein n=1 Tax=Panagrolaimus superbus TaxID=310955 RepID=A0A914YBY6_9BILA
MLLDEIDSEKQKSVPINAQPNIAAKTGKGAKVVTGSADDWPALHANNVHDNAQDSGNITSNDVITGNSNSSIAQTNNVVRDSSEHNSPNGMRNQKVPKNNWKKLDIEVDYNHRFC